MPAILVYATAADFRLVLAHLDADEEIAFLVSAGSHRWRAVEQVPDLEPGRTLLWHRPGGALPLLQPDGTETVISDPFAGWAERVSSNAGRVPFFGSIPSIVTLDVPAFGAAEEERAPMSAFGWIGRRYQTAGRPAAAATVAWWRRLRRWIAGVGVAVHRAGMGRGRGSTVFALPEAQQQLAAGMPGDLNPPTA
jgi:hypothetical protein